MATDDRQSASTQRAWARGGEAVDRSRAYATGGEKTARIAYEQGRFAGAFLSLAGLHLHRPGGRRREGDGAGSLMRASAFVGRVPGRGSARQRGCELACMKPQHRSLELAVHQ